MVTIETAKKLAGQIAGFLVANGLTPFAAANEPSFTAAAIAQQFKGDADTAEAVVAAWKQVAKADSILDVAFGDAMMAAVKAVIEPPAPPAKPAGIFGNGGGPAAAAVAATVVTTASTAGPGLSFEDKVRVLLLREASHRGLKVPAHILASKVKRAGFDKEKGRLKTDAEIATWSRDQVERLDNQAIVREALKDRGYRVDREAKESSGDIVSQDDLHSLTTAISETEADPEQVVGEFLDLYGFPTREAETATAAPAVVAVNIFGGG